MLRIDHWPGVPPWACPPGPHRSPARARCQTTRPTIRPSSRSAARRAVIKRLRSIGNPSMASKKASRPYVYASGGPEVERRFFVYSAPGRAATQFAMAKVAPSTPRQSTDGDLQQARSHSSPAGGEPCGILISGVTLREARRRGERSPTRRYGCARVPTRRPRRAQIDRSALRDVGKFDSWTHPELSICGCPRP
jgi:hypothetical protein